ncbi:MAG: hypothetical protein Q9169_001769 [Polycauliona sp. 2 TL-2023]
MMNPRAYSLSSTPSRQYQPRTRDATSNAAGSLGTRPIEPKASPKGNPITRSPTITSISPAAPSKPVVIPTRTKTGRRHGKIHLRGENPLGNRSIPHDSEALSPSVAAFFAVKSLRDSKGKSLAGGSLGSVEHGQALNTNRAASSASSPRSWKLLLSTPEETEDEDSNPDSENTAYGPLASFRSLSSESMPSLETDTESAYASSSPSTSVGFSTRNSGLRAKRSKSISSSVPEECHSDHPLLVEQSEHEDGSKMTSGELTTDDLQFPRSSRLSFRSNLTASLRRLKYAARNMTSLAATSRDDNNQAQATLSGPSHFADERRPLPWAEPPDPALRRYLNPITISPAELYSHRDHEEGRRRSPRTCTASIQMQTYEPGARKSENATTPPVFVVASPPHGTASVAESAVSTTSERHREPRENSDFLRVIVLEMNMRKVGKLSDVAPGRARLWLPARQSPTLGGDASSEVPRRWISMSA